MLTALINSLKSVLGLWEYREKNEYLRKYIQLKEAFYAEYNKPDGQRDMAKLGNIKHDLSLLSDAYNSSLRK
jgi:hypothetical protein